MISHKHKFIFVHVPKTGGTSIEALFYPPRRPWKTSYVGFHGWDDKNKIWMQHATIQQVNDLYMGDLSEYFKFGFVRNPWDRAVSDWMLFQTKTYRTSEPFVNYLNVMGVFKRMLKPVESDYRADHILPQCDFLFDSENRPVDFIGRFENLQEDFNTVCDKIGIPRQQLPHKHKTKHKHYTEYYDDETREIVAEKYAKDIEYFGYEFGE